MYSQCRGGWRTRESGKPRASTTHKRINTSLIRVRESVASLFHAKGGAERGSIWTPSKFSLQREEYSGQIVVRCLLCPLLVSSDGENKGTRSASTADQSRLQSQLLGKLTGQGGALKTDRDFCRLLSRLAPWPLRIRLPITHFQVLGQRLYPFGEPRVRQGSMVETTSREPGLS